MPAYVNFKGTSNDSWQIGIEGVAIYAGDVAPLVANEGDYWLDSATGNVNIWQSGSWVFFGVTRDENYSVSVGPGSVDVGEYSLQIGYGLTQTGSHNAQFGLYGEQTGDHNLQVGLTNTQDNTTYSTQIGSNHTQTNADSSVQFGSRNTQTGAYRSMQTGDYNVQTSAYASVQMGYGNTQSSTYSLQVGSYNTQGGTYGLQIGTNLYDGGYGQTIMFGLGPFTAEVGDRAYFWLNNGIRLKPITGSPATLQNGTVWYDESTHKLRVYANGVSTDLH